MTNEKYRIREICGDWALDIPFPGSVVTIFFNSRANAELVKKILIHEDAHPGESVPFMQDYFPDTTKTVSLTLEQLREMDGKPVWVETGNKFSDWGKVDFKRGRIWTFGTEDEWWDFRYYGDWLPYAYPPAHIDREAWKAEWKNHYRSGVHAGTGAVCSSCDVWNDRKTHICPFCGKAMDEDGLAMLEKRLRG